jgi:phage terminase large subunit
MVSDMKADKARDFQLYRHVWLGEFRDRGMDGTVYAHELRECEEAGRICHVPYEPLTGVSCFFDLGFSDATAIWMAQRIGYEYHFIDYLEGTQQSIEDYIRKIQAKEYCIDTMYLPHEAKAPSIGTGKSIEEIVRNKGFKTIVVPRLSVADGINAVRTSFKQFYFDKDRCQDGLQALRKYHYNKAADGGFQKVPAHDRWSHCADSLRVAAVALRPSLVTPKPKEEPTGPFYGNYGSYGVSTGWMST